MRKKDCICVILKASQRAVEIEKDGVLWRQGKASGQAPRAYFALILGLKRVKRRQEVFATPIECPWRQMPVIQRTPTSLKSCERAFPGPCRTASGDGVCGPSGLLLTGVGHLGRGPRELAKDEDARIRRLPVPEYSLGTRFMPACRR